MGINPGRAVWSFAGGSRGTRRDGPPQRRAVLRGNVTPSPLVSYIRMMDYHETLRRGGWLPDPGDRVRVESRHAAACPSRFGGCCRCVPRLVLSGVPRITLSHCEMGMMPLIPPRVPQCDNVIRGTRDAAENAS